MSRAMYAAISGMKVNQTKLDVVSNNISNSGTTAYKSARARFSDMISQNASSATAPSNNVGGTNASQVGLGVQLASIDTIFTYGALQSTGRALDVAIDQAGFFIVSKGPEITQDNAIGVSQSTGTHAINASSVASSGSNIMYTRDGAFILDRDGNLLTGSGLRVMGYAVTNDDNAELPTANKPTDVNIGASGLTFSFGPGSQLNGYKIVLGSIGPGTATSATVDKDLKQIVVNANFSSGKLTTAEVQNALDNALGAKGISQEVVASGDPSKIADLSAKVMSDGTINVLKDDGTTDSSKTALEGLTINLPIALKGYTVKIGRITEDTPNSVEISTDAKTITLNGSFADGTVTAGAMQTELNNALGLKGFGKSATIAGTSSTIANAASADVTGGTSVQSISPDGNLYFVDGSGKVSSYDESLKSLKIPDKVKMAGTGDLIKVTSYTITETGLIMGNLENGKQAALGQIALATFKNPEGLEKNGGNLYTTSANSGDAIIRSGVNTTGENNSKGYGSTVQGYLEASNVDLAEQFTDMIIATRAFQANSKAINTGDEILQEIINLKR